MLLVCTGIASVYSYALDNGAGSIVQLDGSNIEIQDYASLPQAQYYAAVYQNGEDNVVELTQIGLKNIAGVSQGSVDIPCLNCIATILSSGNENTINLIQSGTGNDMNVYQYGNENSMIGEQVGNANNATVVHYNNGNSTEIYQYGDGLSVKVTLYGSEAVVIKQQ